MSRQLPEKKLPHLSGWLDARETRERLPSGSTTEIAMFKFNERHLQASGETA
jgi:hypothetical protein